MPEGFVAIPLNCFGRNRVGKKFRQIQCGDPNDGYLRKPVVFTTRLQRRPIFCGPGTLTRVVNMSRNVKTASFVRQVNPVVGTRTISASKKSGYRNTMLQ